MNWDALSAVGTFVGAISVAVTLVYLGRQVHEARRATIAQIYQARSDAASFSIATYRVLPKYYEARKTMSVEQAVESLSPEEIYELKNSLADLFIRMDNNYFQYRMDLMDSGQIRVIEDAIRGRRDLRRYLNINVDAMLLSQEFKDLVRRIEDESEIPDQKPVGHRRETWR